jgi:hypothetical protein
LKKNDYHFIFNIDTNARADERGTIYSTEAEKGNSLNFLTRLSNGSLFGTRLIWTSKVRNIKMKLFEAAYLTHYVLDINWTVLFKEKDNNKNYNSNNNDKSRNQQNVNKTSA